MLKVNNENTRMTSFTSLYCFYCKLWTYFTPSTSVSIADFEQANVTWVWTNFIDAGDIAILAVFEKQYKFMTLRVLFYQLTAGRRRRSINSVKHAVGTGSGIIKRPMLRNFNCISRSRPKKYLFLQPLRSNIKRFQDLQA